MIFDWYKIFNLTEFNALNLESKTYSQELEGIGLTEVLVVKGSYVSIIYEGIFLPINFNSANPFSFEGFGVYLNTTTQDVYLGVLVP